MLTILNRLSGSLRVTLNNRLDDERVLPFEHIERRLNGLYYVLNEDIPYTGTIRRWQNKEEISEQKEFRYGALHGPSIAWYASGSILSHHGHRPRTPRRKSEVHYVCGQKHGLETRWYFDGRPSHHGEYQLGLKHGFHVRWFYNGHKRSEMEFEEGRVCDGTWNRWHANGKLAYEDFYKDNLKVRRKVWSPDGELMLETEY